MKKLIIALFVLIFVNDVKATHLMGGEITWECIKTGSKTGQYVFQMKLYRDCQGVSLGSSTEYLNVHNSTISSIVLNRVSISDLSPTCNTIDGPNSQFSCGISNTGFSGNGNGAVEEHVYRSDTIRIDGTPDANGWHFTWSNCCRNGAITNLSLSSNTNPNEGFTLRAVMYPYTDSLGITYPNNNDCHDSSPKFYERPRTILEVNNGYDPTSLTNGFTYSHNAFDQEQDSITYEWGQPLDNYSYDYLNPNLHALPFVFPYSYTSPINGVTLNSITGRTSYPADQAGNYVTCTKVSAYKCGQLVTEIYREIQVVLIPPTCNIGLNANECNVRPNVQPPFYYPGTLNPYQWDTLVHCGDTVSFDFTANDNDYYPNGSQQNLLFEVSGGQFYNYYDGIPCQNPPCATFEESLTGATPPFTTSNGTGTGQFEWITSCNHVINSCSGYSPSVYTFVVRVSDDFCPAPAIENTAQVISITVFPPCDLKGNLVVNQPSCDLNDGQVIFNPSGGVPPYNTYIFDMNGIPVNRDSLYAGTYQIRITDSTYCEKVDTVVLVSTNNISSSITSTNPKCNGSSDGNISIVSAGGSTPYNYLWNTGDTSNFLQNVVAGQYIVTTTDANNCTKSDTVMLSQPLAIMSSANIYDVNCFGGSDGSIDVFVSGGISPYTYTWNNGDSLNLISNLTAGSYTLSVIDNNSCLYTDSFVVSEPTQLISSLNPINPTCNGFSNGSIISLISGSVPPYSFLWNTGDTTQNLINITAGQYSLVINDSNNCILYDTINITEPNPLLSIDSNTNVSCFGSTNAFVSFTLSGGTPGYLVSAFGQSLAIPNSTTVSIPNNIPIPAGVYPYTITDFQGCTLNDTVIITQPSPLLNTSSIGYITCNGFNNGSISINPSGGTGPYTYLWSTGDTTQFLVNIPSGQYFVSILDSNNCLTVDTILMVQPNQLLDSSSTIMPSCFGYSDGSISVVASGGTMPYNYYWSTGDSTQNLQNVSAGQYILSVIDSNNCILYDTINLQQPDPISVIESINEVSCYGLSDGVLSLFVSGGTGGYDLLWETGDSSVYIDSLLSDWYTISILDSNNCSFIDSFYVMQPTMLLDSVEIIDPSCNGFSDGVISLYPFGSVPPYNYLWGNGFTSNILYNVSSGQYTVIVTDANNCNLYDTINVDQPSSLAYSATYDSVSCNGNNDASIDLTVSGGILPYTYLWNTGDTTEDLSNIIAGSYDVNILDSNDCLLVANFSIYEPQDLFAFFNLNYVSCFGLSDGNIDTSPSGGTLPYSFSWSSGDTTEDLSNIPSDMYILSLTDSNNCFFTDTLVVFEPNELVASLTYNNGTLVSIGTGGTVPYTYDIYSPTGSFFASTSNNMGVSFSINPSLPGDYILVVTDANGCVDSSIVTVVGTNIIENDIITEFNVYPNPSKGIFVVDFNCHTQEDVEIEVYNSLGEQVYNHKINSCLGLTSYEFDLSEVSNSIYFLTLKANTFIKNKILVVQ